MHSADLKSYLGANQRQLRLLAAGVAFVATAGFVAPFSASANVSASLVQSVPAHAVQDFPTKGGLVLTSAEAKAQLPKAKPKPAYTVVQALGPQLITAYTSDIAETDATPFTTANGTRVHVGTVAANGLPFGTKLKIEGFGDRIFTVEDRGGSAFDIDMWMQTKAEAFKWGRRTVNVWIVKPTKV